MGWKLKKRDDVEPILPLKRCFCFDNRMGTFVGSIIIIICTFVELITVILDWFTYDEERNFNIMGAFRSYWKRMFWKGFVICDGVMTLAHCLLLAMAIFTVIAILQPTKFKIYRLKPILRFYYILLTLHILVELGVSCYIYSWYGLAGWRLPFLVWKNLFYLLRLVCNVGFCIVIYSYCCEITEELNQGPMIDEEFGVSTDKLQSNASDLPMPGGNPYNTSGFNHGFDARNPYDDAGGVYANA